MSNIDVDQLLAPISDAAPTGENLEYDPEFQALEIAAQGKAEQIMGDQVKPAEPPDWSEVKSLSTALLARTKDLRVAVHLANAAARLDGFRGLADVLKLINGIVEDYWQSLYPELDEDDGDPILRVNSLLPLADNACVAGAVRKTTMVASTVLGKFSLRDYQIAKGEVSPTSAEQEKGSPEMAHIDGAFMEAELDDVRATYDAIEQAIAYTGAIETAITEQVGVANAPDLSNLTNCLTEVRNIVADQLARRGVGDGADGVGGAGEAGGRSASGAISSREDVIRVLDRICDYFAANEPTSPVPLYLRRAQRMVHMDFLDILREMTPDGVHQAETIFGVRSEE